MCPWCLHRRQVHAGRLPNVSGGYLLPERLGTGAGLPASFCTPHSILAVYQLDVPEVHLVPQRLGAAMTDPSSRRLSRCTSRSTTSHCRPSRALPVNYRLAQPIVLGASVWLMPDSLHHLVRNAASITHEGSVSLASSRAEGMRLAPCSRRTLRHSVGWLNASSAWLRLRSMCVSKLLCE